MARYNRQRDFETGVAQLEPFFRSLGFSQSRSKPHRDKEGTSYSARFNRPPRSVALNHLYSLGPVLYSIGDFTVEHGFYIRELGLAAEAWFPCFADDSVSGYPALLHDLENLLSPFFLGSEADFTAIAEAYMRAQKRQLADDSRNLTYHATGEDRLKLRARELFRKGRYDEVVEIESRIRFPELMTAAERQIFALAHKRRRG